MFNFLTTLGTKPEDALNITNNILEAEKRGVHSHGLMLLPLYISRITQNGIKRDYQITCNNLFPNVAIIDGDSGPGQSIAFASARKCVELASDAGLSLVMAKNSNHVGMLASYGLEIANHNLIGIIMTNTGPSISVPNCHGKVLGNNAICFALPREPNPIIFDFATGVVACGKVRYAALKNETIPAGWIKDKNDNDTTNPFDLDDGGSVLPFGDYKGYGLAFIVDVLTGVLAGSVSSLHVKTQRRHENRSTMASQTFISINPSHINPSFNSGLNNLVNDLRKKVDDILLPGDKEISFCSNLKDNHVNVHEKVLKLLDEAATTNNFETISSTL
ncbi:Ldh family oxidoreductase [Segetibacter sp. 3557_3]|nr:Ldh family oxidoreductase [Segetibacter sp. 3557_3]